MPHTPTNANNERFQIEERDPDTLPNTPANAGRERMLDCLWSFKEQI